MMSKFVEVSKLRLYIILLMGFAGAVGIAYKTCAGEKVHHIRIICTNDTVGYSEPCGCGGRREGGLARRATLLARLTKENPSSVIVESGNISDRAGKLDIITSFLSEYHYDAVGMGPYDFRLGNAYTEAVKANKLTVLDASGAADKVAVPYVIKNIDGIKVGIVSFGYLPADKRSDTSVRKSIYSAYAAARKGSDILILLDQAGIADSHWLTTVCARLGQPDVVMGGISPARDREEVIGRAHVLPTSDQGRIVNVVDFDVESGVSPKVIASNSVLLDASVPEDQAVLKRVMEDSRKSVGDQPEEIHLGKPRTDYYSPETCKPCHEDEYNQWAKTKHARAIQTLIKDGRVNEDCLPCHSEDYRRTRSMMVEKNKLGGVECQTCHGDILPHGSEQRGVAQKVKVDRALCVTCHTKERSPNYDEQKYFIKISHEKNAI